ncbi:MAG: hypothetical protein J6X54_02445 [Treponema sp.]|nr:hypothetical protein [Treponema sp.]
MKKNWIFGVFLLSSLISCSNVEQKLVMVQDDNTIRTLIKNKEEKINWTNDIDGEVLSKDITHNDYFSSRVSPSIEAIASIPEYSEPVLPAINGFGLLDTSSIPYEYLSLVRKAADTIKQNPEKNLSSLFDSEYLFNYVFFIHDLKAEWKKHFNVNYPYGKNLFTNYKIAMQNDSFDLMQIPVRFYCKEGYLDLIFDMSQNKKEIKIQQIEITKWEAEYGK